MCICIYICIYIYISLEQLIIDCACAGNAGKVSPPPTLKETASQRSRHALEQLIGCACGNAGKVSPPPTSKETTSQRSRYAPRHVRHTRALMHVGIANPRWRGKRSRDSRLTHRNYAFLALTHRNIWSGSSSSVRTVSLPLFESPIGEITIQNITNVIRIVHNFTTVLYRNVFIT